MSSRYPYKIVVAKLGFPAVVSLELPFKISNFGHPNTLQSTFAKVDCKVFGCPKLEILNGSSSDTTAGKPNLATTIL